MKLIIALCFVAVAFAAPPFNDADVLRFDNDNIGTGNFRYAVEQSDGTAQEVVGELKNQQALQVKGSYTWQAPDGFRYVVTYIADELGYRSTLDKQGGSGAAVASLLG